jgi:hypothetical protein
MATLPQIAANRLNAQSSTGPKTAKGKQASSRNAVRHGLYASIDSLSAAERVQFDEIHSHFAGQYPQPEAAAPLLDLVLAWFRRERVRRMEAALFDIQLQHLAHDFPNATHDHLLAHALMLDGMKYNNIAKLHRWDRAISREIDRALDTLHKIAETKPISQPAPELSPTQPSLNAPCPCGSGLKFKRCCATHDRKTVSLPSVPPILLDMATSK